MILSVSRRTDIPAFYSEWFMNRIREGFVYVRNPFNANQVSNIPLGRDVVDCVVFWTKNALPILEYLPEISEKYQNAFYFQYTVNPYGKDMEPSVPSLDNRIESFRKISDCYGKNHVVWRYDPILLSEQYPVNWHAEKFGMLLEKIKDYTDTCVVSFIDMYDRTKSNTREFSIKAPTADEMNRLAELFSKTANGSGITIRTCAEGIDLNRYGIKHNSCIDQERIEKIIGWKIKGKPDRQRDNCQCIECADIGVYNTCKHGCRYCYANFNQERVRSSVSEHNGNSPLLIGEITESCEIKNYSKAKSLKTEKLSTEQLSLF